MSFKLSPVADDMVECCLKYLFSYKCIPLTCQKRVLLHDQKPCLAGKASWWYRNGHSWITIIIPHRTEAIYLLNILQWSGTHTLDKTYQHSHYKPCEGFVQISSGVVMMHYQLLYCEELCSHFHIACCIDNCWASTLLSCTEQWSCND